MAYDVRMASYFKFTVRHNQQPVKFCADRHNGISVFRKRAGFWCHSFSDSQAVYNARSR